MSIEAVDYGDKMQFVQSIHHERTLLLASSLQRILRGNFDGRGQK